MISKFITFISALLIVFFSYGQVDSLLSSQKESAYLTANILTYGNYSIAHKSFYAGMPFVGVAILSILHLQNPHIKFSWGLSLDYTKQRQKNLPLLVDKGQVEHYFPPLFEFHPDFLPIRIYKMSTLRTSLSVPLTFNYSMGDTIKFFTKIGVFGSFFIEAYNLYYMDVGQSLTNGLHQGGGSNSNEHLSYGLIGGLGMLIPFKKANSLIFQLDFKYGLRKIGYIDYERYIRFGIGIYIGKDKNQLNAWGKEVLKD